MSAVHGDGANRLQGRCLPPDQRVLTAEGYRPVAAIEAGELIVTGVGRLRPVTAVAVRQASELLYHLRTERGNLLRATGEHPVLARRAEGLPEWVPAGALRAGDAVGIFGPTTLGWWPRLRVPTPPSGGGLAVLREESPPYVGLDWVPLASVDAAPYTGPVYDLDVEEDHSFVSEGIVLGACGRARRVL